MSDNNAELTNEEVSKVNDTIERISSELDIAIKSIKNGDLLSAITNIENSLDITDCPLCEKELNVFKADILHAHAICELDHDTCKEELEVLEDTAIELRDDFIPIKTHKKAILDR